VAITHGTVSIGAAPGLVGFQARGQKAIEGAQRVSCDVGSPGADESR
jgi:hypothetical protein